MDGGAWCPLGAGLPGIPAWALNWRTPPPHCPAQLCLLAAERVGAKWAHLTPRQQPSATFTDINPKTVDIVSLPARSP